MANQGEAPRPPLTTPHTLADTPFVFAVMNEAKITALATIQTSKKSEAVVAWRDQGITKPADLKDKNIG